MGASGPALFSDDLAMDVRAEFRELIEDGVEDAEATRRVVEAFAAAIGDQDDGPTFWLALAFTQSKLGRMDPAIRDRALGIIERGEGLRPWQADSKLLERRKAALEKVRIQLTGPQPPRRRLRPPARHVTDLAPGSVLLFRAENKCALLRVARLKSDRYGLRPILILLDFKGEEPPTPETLGRIPDRPEPRLPPFVNPLPPGWFSSYQAMVLKREDYRQVGFAPYGRIDARPGDEVREAQSSGTWEVLAKSLARWLRSGSPPAS